MTYSLNDKLDFGKFKGFTLMDIWVGWETPTQKFLIDFITWRLGKAGKYEFFDGKQKRISLDIIDYQILNNDEIQIHFKNQNSISYGILIANLNILLGAAERYPLRNFFDPVNDFILEQVADLNKNYGVFADPDYIIWCLKKNNNFCISKDDLELLRQLPCNYFNGLSLSIKSDNIYRYRVNIFKAQKEISKTIEKINEGKLSVVSENQNFHEENRFSHEAYGGIYGLDDDTIDGAFEGDPSNYWNID